ncbi:DUF397 domain-containing protein [Streptomyces sp. NPDC008001]|uniref:DUF397 domain-containing protein n=1 Tax=Streptomyces sp. NPDC008001 TaxID=3364804 RepID=UPI0036EB9196
MSAPLQWQKSTYSSDNGGDCVEVARHPNRSPVHIRDSKNPAGPTLTIAPGAWSTFLSYATR